MKIWIVHTEWRNDDEGVFIYNIEVFSNVASAEKYFNEEINREAKRFHENMSLDFNEEVFAEDGDYDLDNDDHLIQWGNDYDWERVYRVRRKPHYFSVSDKWGNVTEFTITEQEVND